MSEFKVIERKSDVARYEKYKRLSEQALLSQYVKKDIERHIADYQAQQFINKWVEEHYAERVNVKDKDTFSIPIRCITKNGVGEKSLQVSLYRENYADERLNVGTEHHWVRAITDIPSIGRLDWNPEVLVEILKNQDNMEQLYEEYKKAGII